MATPSRMCLYMQGARCACIQTTVSFQSVELKLAKLICATLTHKSFQSSIKLLVSYAWQRSRKRSRTQTRHQRGSDQTVRPKCPLLRMRCRSLHFVLGATSSRLSNTTTFKTTTVWRPENSWLADLLSLVRNEVQQANPPIINHYRQGPTCHTTWSHVGGKSHSLSTAIIFWPQVCGN